MISILKNLCKTRELSEYYANGETNTFDVGIAVSLNDREFAFQSYTKNGEWDGIIAFMADNVFRVQTQSQYIETVKKLIGDISVSQIANEIDENDIFGSLLRIALNRKEIVSIKLMDNTEIDFSGFVESIDEDDCKIRIIDEYGNDDGFGFARISDITEMSYMCAYDQQRMKLWKINQSNNG